jgi:hypothetical protein
MSQLTRSLVTDAYISMLKEQVVKEAHVAKLRYPAETDSKLKNLNLTNELTRKPGTYEDINKTLPYESWMDKLIHYQPKELWINDDPQLFEFFDAPLEDNEPPQWFILEGYGEEDILVNTEGYEYCRYAAILDQNASPKEIEYPDITIPGKELERWAYAIAAHGNPIPQSREDWVTFIVNAVDTFRSENLPKK